MLILTLSITPLRRVTHWNWLAKHRRTLGLFTFAYAVMHLLVWVLLDIQLPEMDGYETADYIRHEMAESVRTIPILAMTASASTKTLENILGHGINDFITKPFEPEALSLKIVSLVNERRTFGQS